MYLSPLALSPCPQLARARKQVATVTAELEATRRNRDATVVKWLESTNNENELVARCKDLHSALEDATEQIKVGRTREAALGAQAERLAKELASAKARVADTERVQQVKVALAIRLEQVMGENRVQTVPAR